MKISLVLVLILAAGIKPNSTSSAHTPRLLLVCSTGKYKSGSKCLNCPTGCSSCTGSSTCTGCKPSYYYNNSWCFQCDPSCATCNGPTNTECLTCNTSSYNISTSCFKCDPSCATCDGPTNANCLTCDTGYYLDRSKKCLICDTGYYLDGTGSNCLACFTGCEMCSGSNYCFQCKSNYSLSSYGECTIKTQPKPTASSSSTFGIGGIIGAVVGSVIFIIIIVVIIVACRRKNMKGTQMTSGQPNSTSTVPGGAITMGAVLPMAPAPGYMAKSANQSYMPINNGNSFNNAPVNNQGYSPYQHQMYQPQDKYQLPPGFGVQGTSHQLPPGFSSSH